MAHFAKVESGIVKKVIVAEEDFIDSYIDNEAGEWVQTSYNTHGGIHKLGNTPLRKNYAHVGGIYDVKRDAFYEQQPYPSWTLNEDTCLWECPVAYPNDDNMYQWNEDNQEWELIEYSV